MYVTTQLQLTTIAGVCLHPIRPHAGELKPSTSEKEHFQATLNCASLTRHMLGSVWTLKLRTRHNRETSDRILRKDANRCQLVV